MSDQLPPAYGYQQPKATSSKAVVALCLGIASYVLCGPLTGIAAIIVGRSAVNEIDRSAGLLGGRGMATAAWILGVINLILAAIVVVIVIMAITSSDCSSVTTENSYSFDCS